jgi:hypothetical protein
MPRKHVTLCQQPCAVPVDGVDSFWFIPAAPVAGVDATDTNDNAGIGTRGSVDSTDRGAR